MPCDTSVSQTVLMNVSAGSLPEGFCPGSLQELFDAMVARMIVTPNQSFTSFVAGSVAPTSNVGPWLKDCERWFVFDPSTATYIPMTKGGFDSMEYFTTSGTFVVPEFIFKLKITAFGGGGGGFSDGGATAGAGGGGGGAGMAIVNVTPGQSIPFTVGAGGPGGNPGTAGGATTILTMSANGGGAATTVLSGGLGGTATGFLVNLNGQSGAGGTGGAGALDCQGGDAGGWGGKGGNVRQNASATGRDGTAPGGGGSGGGNGASVVAGNGATGSILIEY